MNKVLNNSTFLVLLFNLIFLAHYSFEYAVLNQYNFLSFEYFIFFMKNTFFIWPFLVFNLYWTYSKSRVSLFFLFFQFILTFYYFIKLILISINFYLLIQQLIFSFMAIYIFVLWYNYLKLRSLNPLISKNSLYKYPNLKIKVEIFFHNGTIISTLLNNWSHECLSLQIVDHINLLPKKLMKLKMREVVIYYAGVKFKLRGKIKKIKEEESTPLLIFIDVKEENLPYCWKELYTILSNRGIDPYLNIV